MALRRPRRRPAASRWADSRAGARHQPLAGYSSSHTAHGSPWALSQQCSGGRACLTSYPRQVRPSSCSSVQKATVPSICVTRAPGQIAASSAIGRAYAPPPNVRSCALEMVGPDKYRRRNPVESKRGTCSVVGVAKPEHDSCPQCDSMEIGTSFNRSESSGDPKWECHCTECRFKWSEKP